MTAVPDTPLHRTVLVVEDEALIRFELVDMLEDAGFIVHEAGDAGDAIALLEQHPEIRLVITDIQMPGDIDGLRLAHLIRSRWPPTMLIVMSGNLKVEMADLPVRSSFVAKPFHGPALMKQIGGLAF